MEHTLPDDLSCEDIIKVLQQRHLFINDIHALTHSELVRVYKTFALPLSRRPQHRRKPLVHHQGNHWRGIKVEEDDEMFVGKESDIERIAMDIELPSDNDGNNDDSKMTSSINFNPIREKRRPTRADDYQYHLSKATKRIRIDAFF